MPVEYLIYLGAAPLPDPVLWLRGVSVPVMVLATGLAIPVVSAVFYAIVLNAPDTKLFLGERVSTTIAGQGLALVSVATFATWGAFYAGLGLILWAQQRWIYPVIRIIGLIGVACILAQFAAFIALSMQPLKGMPHRYIYQADPMEPFLLWSIVASLLLLTALCLFAGQFAWALYKRFLAPGADNAL